MAIYRDNKSTVLGNTPIYACISCVYNVSYFLNIETTLA